MLLLTPGFYFSLTSIRVNGWIAVELLRVYMSIILYQGLNKSPVKQYCGFLQLKRSETVIKGVHRNGWPYQQRNPQEHLEWIHCYMLTFSGVMASETSFHHVYSNLRQRPLKVMLLNLKFCLSDGFKEFKSLSTVTAGKAVEIQDIGKASHFIWSLLHSWLSWCNWVYEEPSSVSV